MKFQSWMEPKNRLVIGMAIAGSIITSGTAFYGISQFAPLAKNTEPLRAEIPPRRKITALGRLEPQGEVVRLGVSHSLDGDRVSQLLVKRGRSSQSRTTNRDFGCARSVAICFR